MTNNLRIFYIICIALIILCANNILAQNPKKIFNYIKQNKIEEAITELKEIDSKSKYEKKELILFEIGTCLISINEKSGSYNPYNALILYNNITIQDVELIEVNKFLKKYDYDFRSVLDTIYKSILSEAKTINTELAYKKAFGVSLNSSYKIVLEALMLNAAYKECKLNGTSENLNYFLREYPNSEYKQEFELLLQKNAYEKCKKTGTTDSYKYFLKKYGNSDYKNEIEGLLYLKAFENAKIEMTLNSMKNYISDYPKSEFIKNAIEIIDSLALPTASRKYSTISEYIRLYPNSKYTSGLIIELPNLLYNEAIEDKSINLYKKFINSYPNDTRVNDIKSKLELAYIKSLNSEYSENEFNTFKSLFPTSKYIGELNLMLIKENSVNQMLNWAWAKGATGTFKKGGILKKEGKSVITDSQGYVYVVGNFYGETIAFDNIVSNKVTDDGMNSFFTKYDSKGNVIWVKISKENDEKSIAIDSKDNIYISCDNHFIAKYNSDGNKIWEKNITMSGISIAVKSLHSFYLIGSTKYPNKSIVKYDSMGNILWSKDLQTIDGANEDRGSLSAIVATDNIGNVYISGSFSSKQLKFENYLFARKGLNYYTMGSTNGFIIKCDSIGSIIWAKNLGVYNKYNLTIFSHLVPDIEGNVYVTGSSSGFEGGNLTIGNINYDSELMYLIKYDKNGDVLWSRSPRGCFNNNRIQGVAINRFGHIYIAGFSWCKTLSFGKYEENARDGNLTFVAKYNSNGDELCTKSITNVIGTKEKVMSWCNDITSDSFGNVYITGRYEGGGIQFGNSILIEAQRDATFFISKLKLK